MHLDRLLTGPFPFQPRMAAFALPPTTLLLFQLGLTAEDSSSKSGLIPGHGPTKSILDQLIPENIAATSQVDSSASTTAPSAQLKQHFCLAVSSASDVDQWDNHLQFHKIPITGRMDWQRSGKSIYFADPDGHVGEIASRGIWPHY